MKLPLYQVDAFTSRLFGGNPAAVVPLPFWLPDATLQAIAAENNLAETAYFVAKGDRFHLRWFTPAVEVDLCGHATLAAAHVLWECIGHSGEKIDFETLSGTLSVERCDGLLWLDFPSRPPAPVDVHPLLIEALGVMPVAIQAARDYLVVYPSEDDVRGLVPDMRLLKRVDDRFAVIATAPGRDCDFVSRFFAPRQGVDEDPVTGSAHCTLTPYWAKRLNKKMLTARQISPRVGELTCIDEGERVRIGGVGVLYLRGEIELPG